MNDTREFHVAWKNTKKNVRVFGGRKEPFENSYYADISNFTLSSGYTDKDIKDIGKLEVGEIWRDTFSKSIIWRPLEVKRIR